MQVERGCPGLGGHTKARRGEQPQLIWEAERGEVWLYYEAWEVGGADGEGVLSSQDPRTVSRANVGSLIEDQVLVIGECEAEGGRGSVLGDGDPGRKQCGEGR